CCARSCWPFQIDDVIRRATSARNGWTMNAPAAIQHFAMKVLFEAMEEDPINRTPEEYRQMAARIPKSLKVMHAKINDYLKTHPVSEFSCTEFTRFRARDKYRRIESYPTSISIETVRSALKVYKWR